MKLPATLSNLTLGAIFEPFRRLWLSFLKLVQDERMKFVIGLTQERFSHAEFYVNGRKDIRVAKSFQDMEILAKHFCTAHHLKTVDSFMLLRMWCSRKLIRFAGDGIRFEIITFWYF